jgi:periplasmic divalent cation tolerance protein
MAQVSLILTTMPDDDRADALARILVDERLAACVNVHAAMASTYRWKGAIERDVERQLVIKTTPARVPDVEKRLRELHPYELPEILVVPVDDGSSDYIRWVAEMTHL